MTTIDWFSVVFPFQCKMELLGQQNLVLQAMPIVTLMQNVNYPISLEFQIFYLLQVLDENVI